MHSLRTALSLAAFTTANSVINASGPRMEPFVEAMASNSFKQTSCTKKLISAAAETTLMTLITEGPASLRFLNLSVTGISDKNATSRAVAANVLKMMVTCDHQKTVVAGNLAPFMDALKKALQDANASVRETSRGTFTIFRELYPDQANSLYALLDAATKRAIDRTKASAPATSKTTRPSLKAVMAAKKAAAAQKVEPTGSRSITFPVAVEFSAPRTLTAPSSPDAKAAFSNDEPRVHVDDDKESMDVDEHRTSTSDLTASPVATAGNSPIEVSAAPSAAPALEPTQPCTPRSGSVSSSRNRRASRTFTTESDSCPPSPVVRSRNGKMENSSDALGPSVTASYSSTPVARSHDMTKNTFAPTPSTSPFSSHMGSDVMDRLTPSAMDTRGTTPRTADRSAQNMSMDVDESRDDYGGSIMNETLPYGFADTSVVRSVTEYSPPRSPAEVAKSAEPDSINTCTIGPTTPLPSRGRRTYNFGFDTPLKTPINPMAGVERAMRGGTPGTLTKPVEDVINNMEELAQTIERKSARRFNAWRQLWRVWGPKGQTALTSVQKNKLLNHWFDRTLRMAIDFLQDEDPPEGDLVFELVVYLLAELVKLNPKAAEKEARDVIITALVITSWEKRTTSTAAREILRVVKDHFDVSQTMAAIPDIIELQMDDEDTHSQRVVMRAYQFLVELLHHENSMFITSRDIPRMAKPIMMGLRSENSTIRAGTILTIERFYERFADIVLQTWLGDATSIIKYTTLKYLREKGHTLTDDQFWELCR
ncbi:clasp N terminal-domain-containing protein [Gaertneriomyces semiglobifer]|nr:clasp N terminal-domain-containing protein [Gaertneriomyces semiglobifer]